MIPAFNAMAGRRVLRAIAFCGVLVLAATAHPAASVGVPVQGAGSTWVQIALDQWRADIARQGYSINYQPVGSSSGRQLFIGNAVDFAASEIPFQGQEIRTLQATHRTYQYLPDVAGGTSLMYNLHSPAGNRITNLQMNAETAGKIFTGVLRRWQDPAIQALNPGLQIRETRILPLIRGDGSGTSAQFSLYLADQAPGPWSAFVNSPDGGCPAPCSNWPAFPGSNSADGSDTMANFIANDTIGTGSIGYLEAAYAFGREFPVASMQNASGNFTQPTSSNVSTALTHATINPADRTQNLTGTYRAPEPNAYPVSSYSYMITPTTGFDPAKGNVLGTWIIYIACGGQDQAAPLGYSPLPPNLIQLDFDAVNALPGHPPTPPIDYTHCRNPTLAPPGSAAALALTKAAKGAPRSTPQVRPGLQVAAAGGTVGPIAGAGSAAAAAAATPDVTADGPGASVSGAAGATAPVLGPGAAVLAVMDQTRRAALLGTAADIAARASPPPATPLAVAAILLVAAVFAPMLVETLRRRRGVV